MYNVLLFIDGGWLVDSRTVSFTFLSLLSVQANYTTLFYVG